MSHFAVELQNDFCFAVFTNLIPFSRQLIFTRVLYREHIQHHWRRGYHAQLFVGVDTTSSYITHPYTRTTPFQPGK